MSDWLAAGLLKKHSPTRAEINELLALVERDLEQCQVAGLSPDWRLAIAYNAALQCATAALAAAGYRAERNAHHFRVIQSLAYTIGWEKKWLSSFDYFRKKRHAAGYEHAGAVSEQECEEMLQLARKLRSDLAAWLLAYRPELA